MATNPFRAVNTPKMRLYNVVVDALKAHGLKPIRTLEGGLLETVRRDPELLGELMGFSYQDTWDELLQYANQRISEMKGLPLGKPAGQETGGNAGAGAVGHPPSVTQVDYARPPASKNLPVAGGGGPMAFDIRRVNASPTSGSETWTKGDVQVKDKPAQPVPASRLTIEDRLRGAERHAQSILRTLIIGGRPIGEWYAGDAKKRAEVSKFEARVLEVFSHGIPDNQRIGDVLTDAEAAKCLEIVQSNAA